MRPIGRPDLRLLTGRWRRAVCVLPAVAVVAAALSGCGASSPAPHSVTHPRVTSPPGALEPLGVPGSWRLVLNASFDGHSYDQTLWRPGWFGTGITAPINSNEQACYSSDNVALKDGAIDLSVTASPSTCAGVDEPYSGALISTNPHDGRASGGFVYRYGVLEVRIYIPGTGTTLNNWPAVSTYGQAWPQDGEDDLLEVQSGTACFHFHSVGYTGSQLGGCDRTLTAGWHTVASNWEPGRATYYFDGVRAGSVTQGITSQPMYLTIVNTVDRRYPQFTRPDTVRIAYVRVWQRAQAPAPAQ